MWKEGKGVEHKMHQKGERDVDGFRRSGPVRSPVRQEQRDPQAPRERQAPQALGSK